ncbi:MAG TPA: serine/threonine-protein kinase, partial [Kofleriaceae bacterium]
KKELCRHPASVKRFIDEARAVNQIGHPNIVDVFSLGELPDGRAYMVMEWLRGEDLKTRLARGPISVTDACDILDGIARALDAAHAKQIVHRDLKPDNVFLASVPGRWPEVKLLDWGLLKLTSAQSAVSSGRYRTLAGSVMGTPVYMSPEQARASDQVDFRTDIYALGVVSYELLAGVVPFKKSSSIDTLLAHQDEEVPPLAHKCPGLPDELVQLIEAMLAKEPQDRPTLAAVRAVIKRLRGTKIPTITAAGLQIEPLPPTPRFEEPSRGSHPTLNERGDENERTIPRAKTPVPGLLPLPAPPRSQSMPQQHAPPGYTPGQSMQSLPYQSINISAQTTLAGHSVPPGLSSSQLPMYATPLPGSTPPMTYPQGSLPPQSQLADQPLSRAGRLFVIVVAAILASTIGILIAMLI